MYFNVRSVRILTACFCALYLFACASSPVESDLEADESGMSDKVLYTANNLWFEPGKEKSLWCINFKTGTMIPAGTKVSNVALSRAVAGRKAGAEMLSMSFVIAEDGSKYWVNITKKFHPGKTIHDYMAAMFTEKSFDQLTAGMTASEIEAIKKGVVVPGMSKAAVLVSYGIPPEHRTESLESNRWVYWMNRFRSVIINFDENGRVYEP